MNNIDRQNVFIFFQQVYEGEEEKQKKRKKQIHVSQKVLKKIVINILTLAKHDQSLENCKKKTCHLKLLINIWTVKGL